MTFRETAVPQCSVVIPVYRSSETLEELVRRIRDVFLQTSTTFEIVFVDDGSPDDSWMVIERLKQEHPELIIAIQLMRNFGQHNALMCGFRHARGEIMVTIDDDLQNPPEEIPRVITSLLDGGFDLVYGVPSRKRHALGRNLGSSVVNAFFRLVFRTKGTVTSFRAIRRPLLNSILRYDLNFTYIDGLLAWNSQRIGEVVVDHKARANGHSGYSITKLLTLAINLFTNFSLIPLQVASFVGFVASICGLSAGAFYLGQSLLNNISVPGYASIIIAVMTLGGIQLLALGIIGEYIGRLHLNVNRKPQYTERQILGFHMIAEETARTISGDDQNKVATTTSSLNAVEGEKAMNEKLFRGE